MTQTELCRRIGMTAPAISKIVNGEAKPRPITLTKLIHVLCHTEDEYQNIIACYEGGAEKLKEVPEFLDWKPDAKEEESRALRYLQVKAASIRFRNEVENIIQSTQLPYQREVLVNDIVVDFTVDAPTRKIVIECKYNVDRDWDRTVATTKLLLNLFPINEVVIVIPDENEVSRASMRILKKHGGSVIVFSELSNTVSHLMKGPNHD